MLDKNIDAQIDVLKALRSRTESVSELANLIVDRLKRGGKLLFAGNGGSAADSQHLAAEFVGRFKRDRMPLAALALTVDSSALTCIANDYAFEDVFARQLEALGNNGDIFIGISTSGRSPNILNCLDICRAKGIVSVILTGGVCDDNQLNADFIIDVPSTVTARIQEAHILIGHTICELVEDQIIDAHRG